MEVAPRLMFRILYSILPPILCAPNQVEYISSRFVKQEFITREFSKSLADPQIWYGSARVQPGERSAEEHGKEITIKSQLHSGWLQIGWQLSGPSEGGKTRERAEAGSSCPVVFKHVKSDTLTVSMYYFFSLKQADITLWRKNCQHSYLLVVNCKSAC